MSRCAILRAPLVYYLEKTDKSEMDNTLVWSYNFLCTNDSLNVAIVEGTIESSY